MDARQISATELEVMSAWLAHNVEGAPALRKQLGPDTEVFRSCDCGCASIGFVHAEGDNIEGSTIFAVDAEVIDETGASVGGMMLTIRNGRIHDVDIHSWLEEIAFPTLDRVRWHPRKPNPD